MFLYIVRHGQSERNRDRSGPFDCPLTGVGEEQARRAAEWLADKGIETVYCSPSIRTLQTATAIGKRLGLRPKAWGDLVEWGFLFDSPGLTGKEMRTRFPDIEIDDSFRDDVPWIAHKDDESWTELKERARSVLETILERHPTGSSPVALVTHAHFARFLIGEAIGFSEVEGLGGVIEHYNCGITAIEFRPDRTILWYLNAHGHLGDLITH